MTLVFAVLGVLAGALVVAGCMGGGGTAAETPTEETGPRIVQPGAPGEDSQTLGPEDLEDIDPPAHTEADVEFMQNMILHHRQALAMTSLVADRTERADIPLLAERLEISQQDELRQMTGWLEARGEQPPDVGADHAAHMPGMLTDAELARLEAAAGPRFDRLFLRYMIRHHVGALAMVADLRAAEDAGVEPVISLFTGHVEADQSIEISRMQLLLAELS